MKREAQSEDSSSCVVNSAVWSREDYKRYCRSCAFALDRHSYAHTEHLARTTCTAYREPYVYCLPLPTAARLGWLRTLP